MMGTEYIKRLISVRLLDLNGPLAKRIILYSLIHGILNGWIYYYMVTKCKLVSKGFLWAG